MAIVLFAVQDVESGSNNLYVLLLPSLIPPVRYKSASIFASVEDNVNLYAPETAEVPTYTLNNPLVSEISIELCVLTRLPFR